MKYSKKSDKRKTYRILFRKDGMNLAKTIHAESLTEVMEIFKKYEVVKIQCLDSIEEDEDDEY